MSSSSRPFDGFDNDADTGGGGGGGGSYLPPDLIGTGNIEVNGDGLSTGKITGVSLHSTADMRCDGNLSVPLGRIEITTGNLNVDAGNIVGGGSNSITSGTGGITSNGVLTSTGTNDIIAGGDLVFDGVDVIKRTNNPTQLTSYVEYKQLPQKPVANTFTKDNTFTENILMSGIGKTLNNSQGSIVSATGNIETIQAGSLNCGNGAVNSVRCKEIITRTDENKTPIDGWTLKQDAPSNPANAFDKVLDIKGGEANAYITVRSSDATVNTIPNIIINPRSASQGGQMVLSTLNLGVGASSDFSIEQPRAPDSDANNLRVKFGNGQYAKLKFINNNNQDLAFIEDGSGSGEGRLYISGGVYFGTTGIHNHITEANGNLLIDQASSSSETQIRDNSNNPVVRFTKTEVVLSNNIPLNFGLYSTLPIQYKINKTITIASNPDTSTFSNMVFNCQSDTFTRVNDNTSVSMYNSQLEGYYKCTISQIGASSLNNFNTLDIMFDYVYRLSTQTTPDITITEPSYNYRIKPTNQGQPTIRIEHLNTPIQSQPVYVLYSNQSGTETMDVEIRLTKLDF